MMAGNNRALSFFSIKGLEVSLHSSRSLTMTALITTTAALHSHPTVTSCDMLDMAIQAGLSLVPSAATSIASPSDHIIAIAVGVGVPGGLLLLTILVFIIVIFLNLQRLKRRAPCDRESCHQ
jgi:hypothetical protein